jgi:DNA-binding GntR family transcriptional regulator
MGTDTIFSFENSLENEPRGSFATPFPLQPSLALSQRRDLLLMSLRGSSRQGTLGVLGQQVFEATAIAIVEGSIRPGTTINSVELARKFGTSRTPVREALGELERQGVIAVPARRRPYVVDYTLKQVKDTYMLRAALFGLVSELVISQADKRGLNELRRWIEALEEDVETRSVNGYFWHNVGFRLVEIRLTRNDELQRMVSSLGLRTLQFRHLSLSQPERLARSVADHRRLLLAYEERDILSAVAMTKSLIMAGYSAIEKAGVIRPAESSIPPIESSGVGA